MSLLAVLGLLVASLLVGSLLRAGLLGTERSLRGQGVDATMAGLLLLHLLLTALDLTPLAWSLTSSLGPFAAVALLAAIRHWRRGELAPPRLERHPGWGDAVALISLLTLALLALQRRIAASDYIFHWGFKGKRFALAGGTDYELLTYPTNFYLHPDYPNLVPEMFAVLALLLGGFREPAMLLFTVAVYGLVLLASRTLLRRLEVSAAMAEAGLALVALSLLSFAVSWQLTGNADVLVTLAVLLAALALIEPPSPANDLRIGIAAAFAAAAKIEGVALAGFLLAIYAGLRIRRQDWRPAPGTALRTLPLPALVIGSWALQVERYGLRQELYTGSYDPSRLDVVLRQALDISLHDGWHGISLLALLLLPLVWWWRRSRLLALLLTLQLGFYLFAYLTAPVDTVLLVRSSFPRLLMHLVPAILVIAVAVLEKIAEGRAGSRRADEGDAGPPAVGA